MIPRRPKSQKKSPGTSSKSSKIDLNELSLKELRELQSDLDNILSDVEDIDENDIVVSYSIQVTTKEKQYRCNRGHMRMHNILNPARVPSGSQVALDSFQNQVLAPAMLDILSSLSSVAIPRKDNSEQDDFSY